jgi:hypothetical protein
MCVCDESTLNRLFRDRALNGVLCKFVKSSSRMKIRRTLVRLEPLTNSNYFGNELLMTLAENWGFNHVNMLIPSILEGEK